LEKGLQGIFQDVPEDVEMKNTLVEFVDGEVKKWQEMYAVPPQQPQEKMTDE